jgi:hypothetical protein
LCYNEKREIISRKRRERIVKKISFILLLILIVSIFTGCRKTNTPRLIYWDIENRPSTVAIGNADEK